MSIKKIKSGKFEVRVTKKIGNEVREKRKRNIPTKGEARLVEKIFISELNKLAEDFSKPIWFIIKSDYLKWYKNQVTASTFYTVEKSLNAYTALWDQKFIDSFYPELIQNYIESSHKDKSNETKKAFLKYIRGVFKYALRKGVLSQDPTFGIRYKKSKQNKLTAMSREEIIKLLDYTKEQDHPWHPIFRLVYETGMRSGEALALKWTDVNFREKKIVVNRSYCSKSKTYKCTKNGESRIVVLNNNLTQFLKELKLKYNNPEFVLPQFKEWKRGEAAKVLNALQIELGIQKTNFHSLRASFITHLLMRGIPVTKVQHLVGHKDLKTTQRYVRLTGNDLNGTTDCLSIDDKPKSKVLEFKK